MHRPARAASALSGRSGLASPPAESPSGTAASMSEFSRSGLAASFPSNLASEEDAASPASSSGKSEPSASGATARPSSGVGLPEQPHEQKIDSESATKDETRTRTFTENSQLGPS